MPSSGRSFTARKRDQEPPNPTAARKAAYWKRISSPLEKFDVGFPPASESRYQAWKFQVSPATADSNPKGWGI